MNRLKFLRKEIDLSLRKLSAKTGISNPVLSYLETGVRPFRQEHISILTAFFNVTSDFLLGRSDYGYVVYPQFGQEEMTLTEGEYNRLREHISVSLITLGSKAIAISADTPCEERKLTIPKVVVYRELKGNIGDYDMCDTLGKKLDDLKAHMTSEDLEKTIRFIEDYILK